MNNSINDLNDCSNLGIQANKILDNLGCILVYFSHNGGLIYLNALAADILDIKPDDKGLSYDHFIDRYQLALSSLANCNEKGANVVCKQLHKVSSGEEQWVSWELRKTHTNTSDDSLYQLTGSLLSEMYQSWNELESNRVVLYNLVENAPVSIYWKNHDGVYLGCNKYVLQMTSSKSREDIIGKTDHDLIWAAKAHELREMDLEVMRTRKTLIKEEVTIEEGSSGDELKTHYYLSSKIPMLDDIRDEVVGTIGISFDITEQKHLQKQLKAAKEEAEAANEAKSEFIANMSHDIRTPLVAICGIAEVLKADKIYTHEDLDVIGNDLIKSTNVLLTLVDNILDFSKIKSDKFPMIHEKFDMLETIENVVIMISEQAKRKGVKMLTYYSDACPRFVVGDPHRLNRIISNLLGNAVKFTEDGHILISVELVEQHDNSVQLQITVEDTGIGIAYEKVHHIFERFYRVDPSYKGRYKGTGLGLNIVKQFVESMGGKIGVNSQADKGSTFYVSLPFELPDLSEKGFQWQEHYAHLKILIVDDYRSRGQAMLAQLGNHNNQLCTSDKATYVIKKQHREFHQFDIILVDDEIKHCTPESLAELVTKNEDDKETMMVVFMNSGDSQALRSYKEAGYFQSIVKPIQPTELTNLLTSSWQAWARRFKDDMQLIREYQPRILLVEDNVISHRVITIILRNLGCEVEVCEHGYEVLQKLPELNFDLVFLDLGLPDMDGLEVAQEMKKAQDPQCLIPIIALTAHAGEEDRKACLNAGMVDFITKPASGEDLQKAILRHVFDITL